MQLSSDPRRQLQTNPFCCAGWHFSIESIGLVAEQALKHDHHGQILAVFERCFYVQGATGLFCVGLAELGRGPLNVLLNNKYSCLPQTLFAGDPVRVFNHQIILRDDRIFDASQALCYRCKGIEGFVQPQVLLRNRYALRLLQGRPQDGFYWLLGNDTSGEQQSTLQSALRQTTSASVHCLSDWLRAQFKHPNADINLNAIKASMGLIGAGPGLTPSGDDVIAGVMLALMRFQRPDLVKSLWEVVEPSLAALTNPISAAHLEQAAQGCCGEVMDDLLHSIFQAQHVDGPKLVAALDSMGCTSGWDTLGGAVMVIDAWHHSFHTTHRTVTSC